MATGKDREKKVLFSSTVVNRNKNVTISGGKGNIINIGGQNSNSMTLIEGGSQREASKSTKALRGQPRDAASNVMEDEIRETDAVQEDGELRPGDTLEGEEVSMDASTSTGEVDRDDRDRQNCQSISQTPFLDDRGGNTEAKTYIKYNGKKMLPRDKNPR